MIEFDILIYIYNVYTFTYTHTHAYFIRFLCLFRSEKTTFFFFSAGVSDELNIAPAAGDVIMLRLTHDLLYIIVTLVFLTQQASVQELTHI